MISCKEKTLIFNISHMNKKHYYTPLCECLDIKMEGVLAASNEGNQGTEYD